MTGDEGRRELPEWATRSPVPAAMFNPALVATIIATAANQYEDTIGLPMPWPLAHLLTPMALHRPTRQALPKSKATSLTKWASDNTVIVVGLPVRAKQMAPHVREGLRFGLRGGALEIVGREYLRHEWQSPPNVRKYAGDLPALYRAAGLIGRMFGRAGSAASIYATLGVQP